jgi:maltose alpha-D-glucosyltransferase/alpha-amylase
MGMAAADDLWWKDAVLYCLDVETFADSDGDGCGDFGGLTDRIDYLAGIGVTCLWLMPFYPTPGQDDGYDVIDFYGVDPRLGTLGDFVAFVRTAAGRGLRIIVDLVVNHTSSQHPWFQQARSDPASPFRDYYVWRDEAPESPTDLVFPDTETSNWAYDGVAGQHYLHRFYAHQPDLNISNPAVREEIAKIMGFWLQLGVSGFRVDAVPYLLEVLPKGKPRGNAHDVLVALRAFLSRRRGDAILLGEVNLEPQEVRRFFGEHGDELDMQFSFLTNQALHLSLARCDDAPLRQMLQRLPEVPAGCQWANFVRNHDELTLDKLQPQERDDVFAAFGPDPGMQLFGRGLRRRLPPMVAGDRRRIELAYSLAFSLPGTPVLLYGEEIGMAENLNIPGRMSVRTPMQWTAEPGGGFSTADPASLRRPLPTGEYGPEAVNVAAQQPDTNSLLNWMERLIRRRKETPELGRGNLRLLDSGAPGVLAHRSDYDGGTVLALHNFTPHERDATLRLDDGCTALVDLLSDRRHEASGDVTFRLEGYGYRWYRVIRSAQQPASHG